MNRATMTVCTAALAAAFGALPAGAQTPTRAPTATPMPAAVPMRTPPQPLGSAASVRVAPGPGGALSAARPAPMIGPRRKFVFDLAEYTREHPELTHDQLRIGFALATVNRAEREKMRAATLALIRRTHDPLDFAVLRNSTATPLERAASWGEAELVAALLARGVPVDGTPVNGAPGGKLPTTPLVSAVGSMDLAFRGNPLYPPPSRILKTVRVLLKAGANPNVQFANKQTPLGMALIQRPADPAAEKAKVDLVRALLEAGATPGQSPTLFGAKRETDAKIAALLLAHGLDAKANGSRLLAEAVHNRRPEIVKQLLARGADPNARALLGTGPVLADADPPTAKLLVAAGANPNVCSQEDAAGKCAPNGQPVIFWAAVDPTLFRLEVAKGADPNMIDGKRQTALGYALAHRTYHEQGIMKICVAGTTQCMDAADPFDRTVAVRLLLEAGADPNKPSAGKLPLALTQDKDTRIVTMLLDRGAHMEVKTVEGEQIGQISQALGSRRTFLASELMKRTRGKLGADERWVLYAAARDGNLKQAEWAVAHGIDINARGPLGETALHHAARSGDAALIRKLLALGANRDAVTDTMPMEDVPPHGKVPSRAYLQQKFSIYNAAGLTLPVPDDGGLTPLMVAVWSGKVEAARALLDAGAATGAKSQRGFSALDIANMTYQTRMQQLLQGR